MKKPMSLLFTLLFNMRIMLCHPKIFFKWMTSSQRPKSEEIFRKMSKHGLYLTFNTFAHMPIEKTKRKVKFIYGNFENYKYFDDIKDVLRLDFKCIEKSSDENIATCDFIKSTESVCLHIRRGDYLDPKWAMLNVCTFDYYTNAMEHVYSNNPNVKFFVFSNTHDDIEWIKNNYPFDPKYNIEYVDLSNSDYQELELMKNCKHFIMSNSTFSWWAAYLSENSKKIVVMPEIWTKKEETDCSGFYIEGWHKAAI